jgi:LAGLIDADG endonuclease
MGGRIRRWRRLLLHRLRQAARSGCAAWLQNRLSGVPQLHLVQGERSKRCLEELQEFFSVGRLFRNRRHDNHKEDLWRYDVSRRDYLLDVIIPFFRKHPLRTSKHADFERFARCLEICASGRHLTAAGLIEIAEVAETMNHRKSRQELIGILRGHTPDTLFEAG